MLWKKASHLRLLVFAVFFTVATLAALVASKDKSKIKTGGARQTIPKAPAKETSDLGGKSSIAAADNPYKIYQEDRLSYLILQEKPEIADKAKGVFQDFRVQDMSTSMPAASSKLADGRDILLLWGCSASNCGGTTRVIAFDKSGDRAYLLIESVENPSGYEIFGNPDDKIRNLMVFYFSSPNLFSPQ